MNRTTSTSVELLGCRIDALTMSETLDRVEQIIRQGEPAQHVVINVAKVVMMNRDDRLQGIIRNCALVNADGQAIVWVASILKKPLPERVAGIDLMIALLKLAETKRYTVYFLGAHEEVLARFLDTVSGQFPGLRIAGSRNGYFSEGESFDVVRQIRRAGPDILFVGISSPKKEYWLAENLTALNVPFVMGVGGSFDVLAGKVRRAPRWMQKAGLEWLYRVLQEPRRMWKRYLVGNTKFILLVIREYFKTRFSASR
jgi:N-acetylglucosaminyldiphosphoundecaprenol N-acetyl-beta-D-mannosaminyltransferase